MRAKWEVGGAKWESAELSFDSLYFCCNLVAKVTMMQQVVLNIKDESRRQFFFELLKELDFVEVVAVRERSAEQLEFVADLKEALSEVDAHLEGTKSLQSANDFLNEL